MSPTRYSKDHVWIRKAGELWQIGLSDYATGELGEIIFIEQPVPGTNVKRGDAVCSIDSLKSTSDIYAPVSGIIEEINPALKGGDAAPLNSDPLGSGWLFSMRLADPLELELLLSEEEYKAFVG